jgi:Dolichyl-phosphate-mannose-protein mannosyltransferase
VTALALRAPAGALVRWRWTAVLVLAAGAGVGLRVWVYRSAMGVPDSDEAVVGLMALHIAHGQIPTFYWGQAYGGPQEALLAVPGLLLFPGSWLALRLVPIVLSAAAALLVWRVGRRTIGERPAQAAAAVFWVWPPFLVYKLTHQYDFYGSDVVYCALLLLLALRVVERPDRVRAAWFGLVLGLAFWQTSQIVPVAAGAIAWIAWKRPQALRQLWVAAPLAVLGALPWLVWNLRHDWGSLTSPVDDTTSYPHRLRLFVSPVLPMILGARGAFSQSLVGPAALVDPVLLVLAFLFVLGAVRARRREASLLYLVAAVFPFVYAIWPQTLYSGDPRYLVVLTPVLALLVAQLASDRLPRAALLVAAACAVSVVCLHQLDGYVTTTGLDHPATRDFGPLVATLDRLGLDRVYADYWIAYVLDFDTNERIVAVQNRFTSVAFSGGQAIPADDPHPRYAPYQREVKAARHGFVFFRQGAAAIPIVPRLVRHGYRAHPVGPFVVYALPG